MCIVYIEENNAIVITEPEWNNNEVAFTKYVSHIMTKTTCFSGL